MVSHTFIIKTNCFQLFLFFCTPISSSMLFRNISGRRNPLDYICYYLTFLSTTYALCLVVHTSHMTMESQFPWIQTIRFYLPLATPISLLLQQGVFWAWLSSKKRIGHSAALGCSRLVYDTGKPGRAKSLIIKVRHGIRKSRESIGSLVRWILRYLRMAWARGEL